MKKVTLSFDNGPTASVTPYVLETLKARNLAAYFCVVGSQLQVDSDNPALCLQALSDGHRLVNHSLTHMTPLGEQATSEHAQAEIGEMHALMHSLLGDWGEPWFRPFGREGRLGTHVFSRPALELFRELNYSVMLWNSVPRDWVDIDGWVARALEDVEQHDHTLLVLHDIDSGAMRHLPMFLDKLRDDEVQFTLALPEQCVPVRCGVADAARLRGLVAQ